MLDQWKICWIYHPGCQPPPGLSHWFVGNSYKTFIWNCYCVGGSRSKTSEHNSQNVPPSWWILPLSFVYFRLQVSWTAAQTGPWALNGLLMGIFYPANSLGKDLLMCPLKQIIAICVLVFVYRRLISILASFLWTKWWRVLHANQQVSVFKKNWERRLFGGWTTVMTLEMAC